jgi:hypothetical protein
MDVWMCTDRVAKCLRDGNDAGTGSRVTGDFAHQLLDGLVSKASEISQELSLVHEVRPKHLWDRERPERMADVFQKLILEKSGESGGAFCITRRTESTNLT